MAIKRAARLASSLPWLDQVAGVLQKLFAPFAGAKAPRPLKDTLVGTWLGHPLHPATVALPVGAWTTALALDLAGEERAADLAIGLGLSGALVSAVTGAAQWEDATNDEHPRRIGSLHVLANSAATACYAASLAMRKSGARSAGFALSLAGLGFVTAGGQLGGDLAYDLGIGVDHTAFEQPPDEWVDVADASELTEGKPKRVEADGVAVMLVQTNGTIAAIAATCPHFAGPLNKGKIEGDTVTCPWHGSVFSLTDGHLIHGPATAPVTSYEVRVKNGRVEVRAE
ncbi:MAG: Rieske 2Fe-2S domain-containing protein [Thermomicrobiales bacterium]